jgi:hypothetical protein
MIVASVVIERLPARVPAKETRWEITSHENWQWGSVEEESKEGFVTSAEKPYISCSLIPMRGSERILRGNPSWWIGELTPG